MNAEVKIAPELRQAARPRSAVSSGVGLVGLAGLFIWTAIARAYSFSGPNAALCSLLACGIPMVLWSLLVDKVHRNPSTGIDWKTVKPWRETLDVSVTKLCGVWLAWGGIALIYGVGRFWWTTRYSNFPFSMWCFEVAAPILFVLSVP